MSKRKTKLALYLVFIISTFILLFVRPGLFTPLKFAVIQGTSWSVRIIAFPFKELKKVLFYHRTFDEYLRLRKQVNTLTARIIGLDEVLKENNRLEQLLDFKRQLIFSAVAANVTGRDPSNWNATMIIDKGTADGIETGMPVVNALGIVGKVSETSSHKSKVVLLTDSSFSVPALVQRSREVGLVSGTLMGVCRMRYLSANADIQIGDQIITSKISSSFPESLLIGEVTKIHQHGGNNPTVDCILRPAVSLSQIEEVLVIRKK